MGRPPHENRSDHSGGLIGKSADYAKAVMACVINTYISGTILKVDGATTLAL